MSIRTISAILVALLCCAAPGAAQRARKPATHTVTIEAMRFSPEVLKIKPGDVVIWINKDIVSHTATATGPNGFESGALDTGKSWRRTFKVKGDVSYVCRFHPTMTGKMVVR